MWKQYEKGIRWDDSTFAQNASKKDKQIASSGVPKQRGILITLSVFRIEVLVVEV